MPSGGWAPRPEVIKVLRRELTTELRQASCPAATMRVRFSTRILLLAIALVAIMLYGGYVRPSALAERFVALVMREDFVAAEEMVGVASWRAVALPDGEKPDRIYAEVLPTEWQDLWRCRRRLILRVARHSEDRGDYVDWTEDSDLIAGLRGVAIVTAFGGPEGGRR